MYVSAFLFPSRTSSAKHVLPFFSSYRTSTSVLSLFCLSVYELCVCIFSDSQSGEYMHSTSSPLSLFFRFWCNPDDVSILCIRSAWLPIQFLSRWEMPFVYISRSSHHHLSHTHLSSPLLVCTKNIYINSACLSEYDTMRRNKSPQVSYLFSSDYLSLNRVSCLCDWLTVSEHTATGTITCTGIGMRSVCHWEGGRKEIEGLQVVRKILWIFDWNEPTIDRRKSCCLFSLYPLIVVFMSHDIYVTHTVSDAN